MSEFDYVIVGAGSAGCVLASRLTEDGRATVLLLEAGPPDNRTEIGIPAAFSKLFRTDVDWAYRTEPEPGLHGRGIYWPRGRTLGGSSSINAMIYMRGHPADYDGWERLGNEGWSWEDVLPYFKRSEHNERGADEFHGVGGPLNVADLRSVHPVVRAMVESGKRIGLPERHDFNRDEIEGIGVNQVTQKDGRRWSAASAYLKPALRRSNLEVVTNALAHRVVFEGRRATGVEYVEGLAVRKVARARREVILAGGAVNSPHLLLLSGVGPAEHLKRFGIGVVLDLPGVGENLQDHLATAVQYLMKQPISMLNASSRRALLEFLTRRRGLLTSNIAEGNGFLRTRPDLDLPDVQLVFAAALYSAEATAEDHGFAMGAILLQPRSRGRIELRSPHPAYPPAIIANYLSDPGGEDLRTLVEGLKICRRICQGEPLDIYRGEELMPGAAVQTDEELGEYIREYAATLYHPVGTCKMGHDRMAVVDDELRVHGLEGLRVIDASVMPVVPRGNTNAPTIMIGEKGADLVRASAGRPAAAVPA